MNEDSQIFENERIKSMNSFWTTMVAMVLFGVTVVGILYGMFRTPEATHAANCKNVCGDLGVTSLEGSSCTCAPRPVPPAPVREVKALTCICTPAPTNEEERRQELYDKFKK